MVESALFAGSICACEICSKLRNWFIVTPKYLYCLQYSIGVFPSLNTNLERGHDEWVEEKLHQWNFFSPSFFII